MRKYKGKTKQSVYYWFDEDKCDYPVGYPEEMNGKHGKLRCKNTRHKGSDYCEKHYEILQKRNKRMVKKAINVDDRRTKY